MSAPIALRESARALRVLRTIDEALFEETIRRLEPSKAKKIARCWELTARPSQLRPITANSIWLRMAGRGEGKTRSAAEHTLNVMEEWGKKFRGLLAAETIGDIRDIMIEGESGLIACAERRGYKVRYIANRKRVEHPNGAVMHLVSSETPDKPRGFQSNYIWGDETSSWQHAVAFLDNMIFGWRLSAPGSGKQMVLTTTPKPNPVMFRLVKDPAFQKFVTITRGRTADNYENLDEHAKTVFESIYRGTRLGRQELDGELLEGLGAIISQDLIHRFRVRAPPQLSRRVVALDPSITADEDSDAAGIIVVGSDTKPIPDAYVLADYTLETATFGQWARRTVEAFVEYNCDCVVAEVNQGGGGIKEAIDIAAKELSKELGREIVVPVRSVWARESKRARAEPVGALWERGRLHCVGYFEWLEKEATTWLPGMPSPNRLDALVHGVTHLLLGDKLVGPLGAYLT